ncbi:MAG: Na+/H+ antiporter subunit D [Acidimicrobiia bacterium]|nr:Na+/H+ antiporter subunit D [Acidimicrobiia bacterium]
MSQLIPLPVALPLLAAAVCLVLYRVGWAQRLLAVSTLVATVAISASLVVSVRADGIGVADLGGWPAPLGITLVADLLSVVLLVVAAVTLLAVHIYAMGHRDAREQSAFFHPLYLILTAGVAASLLSGDLFNLFVAFEVMLISSYALLTLGGTRAQVRAGMTYVVISLVASALFVTAVAFLYAATGTVNMAQLAERVGDLDPALATTLGLVLLVVFGVKAAIFPLFFWLPDAYPTAAAPITAVFAGLLTKVGVYAIIRTQTLIFPHDGPSPMLLWLAALTMAIGVLGAIAQNDVKRLLSFHIVSQIGYMIFGVALFTAGGVAAAIFYTANQMVVKTSLFLVAGTVEDATGTGRIKQLGGMLHRAPLLAALFAISAMSLAGIPPFSGFVAKLAVITEGAAANAWAVVAVSLAVSVCTLFSMTKVWNGVFWGSPEASTVRAGALRSDGLHVRTPTLMVVGTVLLVGVGVALSVGAGPAYDMVVDAGEQLTARAPYIEAVLR